LLVEKREKEAESGTSFFNIWIFFCCKRKRNK